eukprot:CFRG5482T1
MVIDEGDDPIVTADSAEPNEKRDNGDVDETNEVEENQICELIASELAKPYCDREVLRSVCAGATIPSKVRGKLWMFLLGVDRKPNVLGSWKPQYNEFKTAALLKAECQSEAEKLVSWGCKSEDAALDMETILNFYCHTRSCQYRPGWAEIVRPLLTLNLPLWRIFNCFYAMVERYLPYSHGSHAKTPYQFFRMLLQYHDPELSHFLDTKKLDPQSYMYSWLRSLYSYAVDTDVVLALWDLYLLEGNVYLAYFMSLAVLINSRDSILELSTTEEIRDLLPTLLSPLNVEDAEDFVLCALYYYNTTPHSIRNKDLQLALFSPGPQTQYDTGSKKQPILCLSDGMCLSVSATEIHNGVSVKANNPSPPLRYIVLDVRSIDEFQNGRLATAIHVDVELLMENPDKFYKTVEMFAELNDEHICIYGSSKDESHLRMIVSYFLQRNFKHVSCVVGGYEQIHDLFVGTAFAELADHKACHLCNPESAATNNITTNDRYSHSFSFERFAQAAKKLTRQDSATASRAEGTPTSPDSSGTRKEDARISKGEPPASKLTSEGFFSFVKKGKESWNVLSSSVEPTQKADIDSSSGTPDRRTSSSSSGSRGQVFGIGDSEEDSDEDIRTEEDFNVMRKVHIEDDLQAIGVLHLFECSELVKRGQKTASCIAVSDKAFFVLRTPQQTHPVAYIKESFPLWTLSKITANKKDPDLLTFVFKTDRDGKHEVLSRRFKLQNSRTCSQVVGQLVVASVRGRMRHTKALPTPSSNTKHSTSQSPADPVSDTVESTRHMM